MLPTPCERMKAIMKNSGFSARLFLFFFVFVFCFLAGLLTGIELFGDSMTLDLRSFKWLQLVQSVFSFVLPPLVFASMCSERPLAFLGMRTAPALRPALLVVLAMLVAVPCINLLAWLNDQLTFPAFMSGVEARLRLLEQQAALQTDRLLLAHNVGGLFANLVVLALVPALGEEMFFRGGLQRLFGDLRPGVWTVWLAAFVFSAVHMQFFGFVPRLLMGAFFGYLLLWSGNLWLPVLAHFVNNAGVVLFRYLQGRGHALPDLDTIGTGSGWWIGVLSAVAFVAVLLCLRRCFVKPETI